MHVVCFTLFLLISSISHAERMGSINSGPMEGGVYLGGKKTPASFWETNLNVDYQIDDYELGLSVGTMQNNSALKNYTFLINAGLVQKLQSPYEIYEKIKLGVSFIEEKTQIQGVGGSGLHLQAEVGFRYHFEKVFVGANITYYHSTFSNSYWGQDLFSDLALDFISPHLTLGMKF